MATKNLKECITQAVCVGPASETIERLADDIQDFIAHEVMKFSARKSDAEQKLLIEFFNYVFRKE